MLCLVSFFDPILKSLASAPKVVAGMTHPLLRSQHVGKIQCSMAANGSMRETLSDAFPGAAEHGPNCPVQEGVSSYIQPIQKIMSFYQVGSSPKLGR